MAASVEHATAEARHNQAARELSLAVFHTLSLTDQYKLMAQALADWERAGEEKGWADAKAAVRGSQPNPPRTETASECFSANSKRILDVLREMDYYRHPESRPR